MPIGEICNREVVFARRNEPIGDAARLMREHHVGDLVVIDEKDEQRVPAGVITDRDIVVEVVAKNVDPNKITIGDAMSTRLFTVRESDGIYETIQLMRGKGVRRLPVVNDRGGLVGIVSIDDLLELIADEISAISSLANKQQARERSQRAGV